MALCPKRSGSNLVITTTHTLSQGERVWGASTDLRRSAEVPAKPLKSFLPSIHRRMLPVARTIH
jgi:hypothetical protein